MARWFATLLLLVPLPVHAEDGAVLGNWVSHCLHDDRFDSFEDVSTVRFAYERPWANGMSTKPGEKRDDGFESLAKGFGGESFWIRPELAVGYGYDSNLFHAADTDWETPTAVHLARFTPALDFGTGSAMVRAHGIAAAHIDQVLSSKDELRDESNLTGMAALEVAVLVLDPVSVVVRENFSLERLLPADYMVAPHYHSEPGTEGIARYRNRAGLGLFIGPGQGKVSMQVGYTFGMDRFLDYEDSWGDLSVHELSADVVFEIHERIHLVADGEWQLRDYLSDSQGRYGELTDSEPIRVRAGARVQVVQSLSLNVLIGYGGSSHEKHYVPDSVAKNPNEDSSFSAMVGEFTLLWQPFPGFMLKAGFLKDFSDSLFSNYIEYSTYYLSYRQRLWDRLELSAGIQSSHLDYSQLPKIYFEESYDPNVVAGMWGLLTGYDREDKRMVASLSASFDISHYLALTGTYGYVDSSRGDRPEIFGSCVDAPCNSPNTFRDYVDYTQHFATASLVVRY